jgi:hypothetical protein
MRQDPSMLADGRSLFTGGSALSASRVCQAMSMRAGGLHAELYALQARAYE